jgi:hypothetical protein
MKDADRAELNPLDSSVQWTALLLLWAFFLSVLVRWPLSVTLGAVPLDPNSPLHALALDQLAHGGSWTEIANLAFPTPVPIRMVALPTLGIGLPLAQFLSPLAALNLATTCMVAAQGLAIAWLVGRLNWGRQAQLIAITAGICAPFTVHVQALGQQENLGFVAFALAVAASMEVGRKGWFFGLLALLLAGFSSPYMAVPTGILLLSVALFQGRSPLLRGLACTVLAGLPVLLYYTGATDGSASIPGITTSPPEEGYLASAGIWDMLSPRAMWDGVSLTMDGPWARLSALGNSIPTTALHPGWIWTTAHQSAYIGVVLLLGILALWTERKNAFFRPLILACTLCLLFALGPNLRILSEHSTGIPLPWALFSWLPGLSDLQATHRFLAGSIFVLVIGLAWWGRNWSRPKTGLLCLALMTDGLLFAPAIWPLPAAHTDLKAVQAELPDGPTMLWPPLTSFAPQYYELMAVLLERPVGIYTPSGVTLSGEIHYAGSQKGYVRLDIIRKTGQKSAPFEVIHATTLSDFGPWSMDVEVDLGKINLVMFLDAQGNGPDPNEPQVEIEGVSVAYQNIGNLDFHLTDPGINAETVEAERSEPLQPGTRLPSDLPDLSGNISQEDWLQRGAFGGAKSLLRTQSVLSDTDSGFRLNPSQLRLGEAVCVDDFHCIQSLESPMNQPGPRR